MEIFSVIVLEQLTSYREKEIWPILHIIPTNLLELDHKSKCQKLKITRLLEKKKCKDFNFSSDKNLLEPRKHKT